MPLTKEHFSPRGYLRGFIHPSRAREPKPLWVLDVRSDHWSERSPAEIGYEVGFYTPLDGGPSIDFESFFREPERLFPQVRDRLDRFGPEVWRHDAKTLIGFAALMSARSPLFVKQAAADHPKSPRQAALVAMAMELTRRPSVWLSLHWCLRYVKSADNGIPTCDQPVVVDGLAPGIAEAFADPDTRILFPVSWRYVLFGSIVPFEQDTAPLPPPDFERLRSLVRAKASRFYVSTLPIFEGAA